MDEGDILGANVQEGRLQLTVAGDLYLQFIIYY